MNSPYSNNAYPGAATPAFDIPPSDTLPPPWVQQFDTTNNAPFYVNTQTNESSWVHPFERDEYRNMVIPEPSPSAYQVDAGYSGSTRGMSSNGYQEPYASSPYPSQDSGAGYGSSVGGGQAASFYNSGGGAQPYQPSQQGPIPDDDGGAVGPDGERGIGKVVAGGVALYMAKKMFDKWQAGKKPQQHQPHYGAPPVQSQSYPSSQQSYGMPSMVSSFFGSNKPPAQGYNSYGPPPYGSGYGGPARDVNQAPSPAPPAPYGIGSPAPYGQTDYCSQQQPQSQAYPYGPPAPQQHSSGWGDPRY